MTHHIASFDAVIGIDDGTPTPSPDEVFDALAHSRRRLVLRALRGRADPVSLAELAGHVGTRESNATVADLDPARRQAIRAELVHVHLPKLADYGLVEIDEETVEPATDLGPVCDAIDVISRYGTR